MSFINPYFSRSLVFTLSNTDELIIWFAFPKIHHVSPAMSSTTNTPMLSWAESQWISNDYCSGPPSTIIVFTLAEPDSYNSNYEDGLNWPIFYADASSIPGNPFPYSYCGNLPLEMPLNSFCCVSSLDLSFDYFPSTGTFGIASGADIMISENSSISDYVPLSANGNTYCELSASTSDSLFTYSSIYLLCDSSCTVLPLNGSLNTISASCSKDGILNIYPESASCLSDHSSSEIFSYQLERHQDTSIDNSVIGSIIGKLIEMNLGNQRVGWVSYNPYCK